MSTSNDHRRSYRSVLSYAIGGGWGDANPHSDSVPVRVIRGTDFRKIKVGDFSSVPSRHESKQKVERRALVPGDVILEISGGSRTSNQSTGRSMYVTQHILDSLGDRVIPASFCRLLRFDPSFVNSNYAYWCLQSMYVSGRASIYEHQSTGISNFQFNYFLDTETITVLTPQEQSRIVCILNLLDQKIELNLRMNETLESIARAIFKDWFGDFGPVRHVFSNCESYLPNSIGNLFPTWFTDSSIGEIPATWQVKPISKCFDLTMGQSPPGSSYNEEREGLPFFQGSADFGVRFPDGRRFCSAPKRVAEKDDTLVSVRAPVGDINMAWSDCCIGRGVAALRHRSKSSSYTYYAIDSIRAAIAGYEDSGTVFGAITRKQFENLPLVDPDDAVVRAFDSLVNPMDARIRLNVAESRNLAQIRDTLLPKLMSGEIRIADAERVVESVA